MFQTNYFLTVRNRSQAHIESLSCTENTVSWWNYGIFYHLVSHLQGNKEKLGREITDWRTSATVTATYLTPLVWFTHVSGLLQPSAKTAVEMEEPALLPTCVRAHKASLDPAVRQVGLSFRLQNRFSPWYVKYLMRKIVPRVSSTFSNHVTVNKEVQGGGGEIRVMHGHWAIPLRRLCSCCNKGHIGLFQEDVWDSPGIHNLLILITHSEHIFTENYDYIKAWNSSLWLSLIRGSTTVCICIGDIKKWPSFIH